MTKQLDAHFPRRSVIVRRLACSIAMLLASLVLVFGTLPNDANGIGKLAGSVLGITSLLWARRVLEAGSVRLDQEGIHQTKLLTGNKLMLKVDIRWDEVVKVYERGSTCIFSGTSRNVRADIAYFSDSFDVAGFARARVPSEVLHAFASPQGVYKEPSRPTTILLALALLLSLVLAIDVVMVAISSHDLLPLVVGLAATVVLLEATRRAIESFSIRLSELGVEQITLFRGKSVLRRTMLMWKNVERISGQGQYTCLFFDSKGYVRINFAVFVNPRGVATYISERLPEHLHDIKKNP